MQPLPSIFVSHGAPTLLMQDCPATRFFHGLGTSLGRPSAIVCVSAHWETRPVLVSGAARLNTIHDFYGFPPPLYEERYDVSADPALAARVRDCLSSAGIATELDAERGIDHGAWVPLKMMYPEGDIPVLQVSVSAHGSTADHLALGRALAELRDDGVLVLGSGSATHNLRAFRGQAVDAAAEPRAQAFRDWLAGAVSAGDAQALLDYRAGAPEAVWNHPTEEHIMPLFAAMGAGREQAGDVLHASYTHGVLAMDAYAFR